MTSSVLSQGSARVSYVSVQGRDGEGPDEERPVAVADDARDPGRRGWTLVRRAPALLLVGVLRVYQLVISPMEGPTCRYYPSCSQYAVIAVQRHGVLRGSWLAVRRLGRCHPWTPGGVDDVPPVRQRTAVGADARKHTSEELR